jgi:hypothetical protein
MLPDTVIALVVLTAVVVAIVARETTAYASDSLFARIATRVAVGTVIAWFVMGLVQDLQQRRTFAQILLSRRIFNGTVAIVIVCLAFRDEW